MNVAWSARLNGHFLSSFFAEVWQQSRLPDHCLPKRSLLYLECAAKVSCCGYRCAAGLRRGLSLALSLNIPYVPVPTAVFKSATISHSMVENESSSLILSRMGLIRYTLPSSVDSLLSSCSVSSSSVDALLSSCSGEPSLSSCPEYPPDSRSDPLSTAEVSAQV